MSNILSTTPFGALTIAPLFGIDILQGISRSSTHWQVLEAFLRTTEGRAARVSEGSSGLIILSEIPGDPNSGAFYLYDEPGHAFFQLSFADKDTFHASMFDYVVQFYDLGKFIEIPATKLNKAHQSADTERVTYRTLGKFRPNGRHPNMARSQFRTKGVNPAVITVNAMAIA